MVWKLDSTFVLRVLVSPDSTHHLTQHARLNLKQAPYDPQADRQPCPRVWKLAAEVYGLNVQQNRNPPTNLMIHSYQLHSMLNQFHLTPSPPTSHLQGLGKLRLYKHKIETREHG